VTPFGQSARLGAASLTVVAGFLAIAAQLAHLHLGDHAEVRQRQREVRQVQRSIRAPRGRILDRDGQVLAIDRAVHDLIADPAYITEHGNARATADLLGGLVGLEVASVHAGILGVGRAHSFLPLKRNLESERVDALKLARQDKEIAPDLRGVRLETRYARTYPLGNSMCHVVGFANSLGAAAAGIELKLNHLLRGRDGLRVSERDGAKQELFTRRVVDVAAEPGFDVHLTLDRHLQFRVEQILDRAMLEQRPQAAWAIVMDTRTGMILALASKPDFNPNQRVDFSDPRLANHPVHSLYEPGSVLKAAVFAAVFNEKLATPTEMVDCTSPWVYGGARLRDGNHSYGMLPVMDVLKKSSNVGTAKLAMRLGEQRLDHYLRAFGLGEKTGIELPLEASGEFRAVKDWDKLSLSRFSIGQGVSATALQMVNVLNTIANDGLRMQPSILRRITNAQGGVVHEFEPKVVKRVIDIEAARLTRRLLARVTEAGGTGRRAALEHCAVAGKTGTAQIYRAGGYSHTDYVASFGGFLPAEDPRVTIIVVLDQPPMPNHQGGKAAAPIFREIAEEAVRILNLPTQAPPEQTEI
jgi:cell division protein FtsI (penicillin-binding protein 3)